MGRPKSLLRQPLTGHSFVGHLIRVAHDSGLQPILVVVRNDGDAVADEVNAHGGTPVVNPDPDRGQLSSLLAALPLVEASGAEAMLLLPVDVARVSAGVVTDVLEAAADETVYIARAGYRGAHGHPVLFKRAVFDELRTADPTQGARAVVRADPGRVRDVEVNDPGVTLDIDTPEDYFRAFGLKL